MPDIAGGNGQSVFPGDSGELRIAEVKLLPPFRTIHAFQLGGVAAPFIGGRAIKLVKSAMIIFPKEFKLAFQLGFLLSLGQPLYAPTDLRDGRGAEGTPANPRVQLGLAVRVWVRFCCLSNDVCVQEPNHARGGQ